MTFTGQGVSTGQAGRSCTDNGNLAAGLLPAMEVLNAGRLVIQRITLQRSNIDGIAFRLAVTDTGAFAQNFGWANPGAAAPKNIGFKNGLGGTVDVVFVDAVNKRRNINMSRAGTDAGCCITVQAAAGFRHRKGRGE